MEWLPLNFQLQPPGVGISWLVIFDGGVRSDVLSYY
ncbi:hypothetical protein SLEP1_g12664 [Rubroshorea leprosula]|uniref:Uncharacterized protein n=1 Tax=Rubroshorea leprosula TaxID=152421 RepID=A0AAV5IN20_9ROSI|nr:hypothetical protein SLEP1_g12664 [Rubroshorea leprosula]